MRRNMGLQTNDAKLSPNIYLTRYNENWWRQIWKLIFEQSSLEVCSLNGKGENKKSHQKWDLIVNFNCD